jgi:hypothetical protein
LLDHCHYPVHHSSVADVAVIFAVAPFLTAGLGWLWLGVKEPGQRSPPVWLHCSASQSWSAVPWPMVICSVISRLRHDSLHGDHDVDHPPASRDTNATGRLFVGVAVSTTGSGRSPRRSMSAPSICSSCSCSARQFDLGLVFLTVGGQMVSATENALINTLETPLPVSMGVGLFQQGTFYRQTSQAA